jgi:transcriptional regulator with XRE-family HTH domain
LLTFNLKFLRKNKKLSQGSIAEKLGISRPTWSDYEKGKSEPVASMLKKISDYFEIGMDDMLSKDLERLPFSEKKPLSASKDALRVVAITVNEQQKQNIELIPVKAIAGYAQSFSDTHFIKELPRFAIPKLQEGLYRAFEIQGTSMLPIHEGAIVIGRYVEHIRDFRNHKRYVIVCREEGLCFKRIFKSSKEHLILMSDNPEFAPFNVPMEAILEAWEMVACIEYGDKPLDYNAFLMQKMNHIEQKINQMMDTQNKS